MVNQIKGTNTATLGLQQSLSDKASLIKQLTQQLSDLDTQITSMTNEIPAFNLGPTQENASGVINLQSGQCRNAQTSMQSAGSWTTDYLDRLTPSCAPDEYLTSLYLNTSYDERGFARSLIDTALRRNSSDDRNQYVYKCCKVNPNVKNARIKAVDSTTPWSSIGDRSTKYLDRHTLDCGDDGMLNKFGLSMSSDRKNIRYNYTCLKSHVPYSTFPNSVCTELQTNPNVEGDGYSYLDRHVMTCPQGQALASFNLVRDPGNKFHYNYKCCSTMLDQPQ